MCDWSLLKKGKWIMTSLGYEVGFQWSKRHTILDAHKHMFSGTWLPSHNKGEWWMLLYYMIQLKRIYWGWWRRFMIWRCLDCTIWTLNWGKATRYLNFKWTFNSCNGSNASSLWWPNGIALGWLHFLRWVRIPWIRLMD